ncbi:MAG: hypothetical protein ACXWKC_13450 [Xanthobacteraceae bacterium]
MADYYPLITRAITGLDKNTGEARRGLYERARNALVEQLRGVTPALSETDITRERLALEEAIRKVEAEAVRQMRSEPPPERRSTRAAPAIEPEAGPSPSYDPQPDITQLEPDQAAESMPEPPVERPIPPPQPRASQRRWLDKKPATETGPGIRGFGDVVADAENLGSATAQAGRSARETYSSVQSPTPEFDRLEPRMESPTVRRPPAPRPRAPERRTPVRPDVAPPPESDDYDQPSYDSYRPSTSVGHMRSLESPMMPDSLRQVVERARRDQYGDDGGQTLLQRLMGGAVKIGVVAIVILLIAGTTYWQRNNLASLVRSTLTSSKTTTQTPARDTAQQQRAKIPDRIGQVDTSANSNAARPQDDVALAQRTVLYEDDPVEPAGKQYVGTVTWSTETSAPAPGQPPDRAIRADITIPDRKMQVTMIIRRNTDRGLPATHTVHISFVLPPDFSNGSISEIRGMLMKQAEDTRGTSLAGLAVKVTPTYFMIGLSSASDGDIQRNIQLLKERSWFDIAIVYENGRRAILAVEKGTPGDKAFADAFASWQQ